MVQAGGTGTGRQPSGINGSRRPAGAALAVLLAFAPAVQGKPVQCGDPLFAVIAGDHDLAARTCAIAPRLRDELEDCGLEQERSLTIAFSARIVHSLGDCAAFFDCERDLLRIVEPQAFDTLLAEDSVYSKLPEDVTLQALLAHELTHALIAQTAEAGPVAAVDQEYIAAAMELELMEPEWRAKYLEIAGLDRPPSEGLIDIWFYAFSPRIFAVNAWRHFRQPDNGCALVERLVSGDASYAKPVRPELQ